MRSSILRSHQPHFKCSADTRGFVATILDGGDREHFHPRRKFSWTLGSPAVRLDVLSAPALLRGGEIS